MIARVSGILILITVPRPAVLLRSMVPPIRSMLVLTTSMPTPRPEILVTLAAVERPAEKISCSASRSLIAEARSEVIKP